MAESLGGSRGRNGNSGPFNSFGFTKTQGRTGGGGGFLDRPATARAATPSRGGVAAVLGGGGGGPRPSSAPRERPPGEKTRAAQARVEEVRQVREAQYWGREDQEPGLRAPKRDLPPFWSVREHGQPFNDERLATGVANFFRLAQPAGLAGPPQDPMASALGPASMQQAALRKSLETGTRHFTSISDLAPLPHGTAATEPLSEAEREFLLSRLTPYQRIHALHQCLDKDQRTACKDWIPWPLAILNRETLVAEREGRKARPPKYELSDWKGGQAQRDMLMRLAIGELEYMMRRHLKFMSDRACSAARAPSALEKDILRQAFWRVDPQRTGEVSIQQFLQVWQNVLRLMEYEDAWIKGRDTRGKTRHKQVLKPIRTVLLDRNMAAALFVKYGFDKEGLMPYVVYINALCETPNRLLGHEIVLKKKERGKNGLEDELDIAMCLGNAKIEYRYCKAGVFPPGEFTGQMGKRSFKPPKAHMWLEHVYGYAGMLDYTRQSNIFYTHNTGKPLTPGTSRAVQRAVLASQGSAEGTAMRTEQLKRAEFVYYTGSVGVVFDKEKYDAGLPCQRFFFGHNNDIDCLTIHPNRRWVATGQQKATGPSEVPYVCIWDVEHCMQLQRLDHDRDERGVIALCFSGDLIDGKGGDLLLTVTSDDKHSIHVWRWLPHSNKYINAHYIPGWYLGPDKKIRPLRTAQKNSPPEGGSGVGEMYTSSTYGLMEGEQLNDAWLGNFPFDLDNWKAACVGLGQGQTGHGNEYDAVQAILEASRQPLQLDRPSWEGEGEWWAHDPKLAVPTPGSEVGPCGLWSHLEHPDVKVRADDADGMYTSMRPVKREEGFLQPGAGEDKLRLPHLEQSFPGCNGTPPMVYGVVWNRLRPSSGRRGSEFASYGIKHLKTWIANDEGRFIGTPASFGTAHIENILSALYVPAMHAMSSPGDSCLLTGFASGKLGLWVPPYPTRVGAVYTLVRHFNAHAPGKLIPLVDGTQVNGGVRALSLRRRGDGHLEVLSGGADGCVRVWRLEELSGARPDGTPAKGVKLGGPEAEFKLVSPGTGLRREEAPLVVALDCHSSLDREFLAGTDGCDIWEVDADPRVLVEGHEDDLDEAAPHAESPYTFATACKSGKLRVWDARRRDVSKSADLGYPLSGIAYSQEPLPFLDEGKQRSLYEGYHLAVSGQSGELTVMRSDNLQPLVHRQDVASKQAIPEMKYSPVGGPRLLAAACSDAHIYIYRADKNYQLLCKCVGHSSTVKHVDWSLPVLLPGTPMDGKFALQSCDASGMLLYWDPTTGKKLPYNMRDTEWHTWTLPVGFDVMGIWPDCSNGTDVNAVDRGRLGAPIFDPYEAAYEGSTEAAMHYSERDSADGISGAGFVATADDFSTVKLFNFPVVADDAPYKAFRGHASHVTSVRFLSDDQLVVSVGGHDRGIYQWRTCGLASGLPPLPVIYRMLDQCEAQGGRQTEASKALREGVWERLLARARAFRSYERLKLFAARVAIEEKRINSAASAKPQPKLPEQLVWAKVPGSANQYGPIPRNKVEAEGGGEKGGGTPRGGGGGTTPRTATPRVSAAPSPRGSAAGSSPSLGPAPPARASSIRTAGSVSPPPPPPLQPLASAVSAMSVARSPSVRTTGSVSPSPAAMPSLASAASALSAASAAEDEYELSGEVGSYEPSGVASLKTPQASTSASASASTPPPPPPAASGEGSASWGGLGGSGVGSGSPSLRGSRSGAGLLGVASQRSGGGPSAGGGGGPGGGGGGVGGRSGRRYVSDSIPDEGDDGGGVAEESSIPEEGDDF